MTFRVKGKNPQLQYYILYQKETCASNLTVHLNQRPFVTQLAVVEH